MQTPAPGKWWVEFTDKNNSPYSIHRPSEFLSARALERRARAGIAVAENDLPVNPAYVQALRAQPGIRVHHSSRWMNAATVVADSAAAAGLKTWPFVKSVTYLGRHIAPKNPPNRPPKQRKPLTDKLETLNGAGPWGYATLQNNQINVLPLHEAGHRGDGIWIAVLDGGFTNVEGLAFFDSVDVQGRLYPGWDFVEGDGAVYEGAMHGTSVLSVMAGNLPYYYVGTAPEATYFLVKTEDTAGEYPVEEANWIAGAEWADSLGADIINASLGYTTFNDNRLNYRFATLDGRTAIGSRGAAIAAAKGMIVCNSAGNSGDEPWRHIGVPADAPGVVAVGAVEPDGRRASFSSLGPSADGRIKPDLVAPGEQVTVAGGKDAKLGMSSGTSLASPILAGGLASLWSAFPEKTAAEILDAVFRASDQRYRPDNERGYGLPNLTLAWLRLGGYVSGLHSNDARAGFFAAQRDKGRLSFLLTEEQASENDTFELRDALGRRVAEKPASVRRHGLPTVTFDGLEHAPPGMYRVVWRKENSTTCLLGLMF